MTKTTLYGYAFTNGAVADMQGSLAWHSHHHIAAPRVPTLSCTAHDI